MGEQSFKIGDTVKLKGGGPIMTISGNSTEIDPSESFAWCCEWIDAKGSSQYKYYSPAMLKSVQTRCKGLESGQKDCIGY